MWRPVYVHLLSVCLHLHMCVFLIWRDSCSIAKKCWNQRSFAKYMTTTSQNWLSALFSVIHRTELTISTGYTLPRPWCLYSSGSHRTIQHDHRDSGCWMVQRDHRPWSHPNRTKQQVSQILRADEMRSGKEHLCELLPASECMWEWISLCVCVRKREEALCSWVQTGFHYLGNFFSVLYSHI